jgi:hypothetical protein
MEPTPSPLALRAPDCPNCQAFPGVPFHASSVPLQVNRLRVGLRCPKCHHEWQVERDVDCEDGWRTPAALD